MNEVKAELTGTESAVDAGRLVVAIAGAIGAEARDVTATYDARYFAQNVFPPSIRDSHGATCATIGVPCIPGWAFTGFRPPASVRRILMEAYEGKAAEYFGYLCPVPANFQSLPEMTAATEAELMRVMLEWLMSEHRLSLTPEHMVCCRRAYDALIAVCEYCHEQGRQITALSPRYSDFKKKIEGVAGVGEGNLHDIPMVQQANGTWEIDEVGLRSGLPLGGVLIVTNPNNPTGKVYTHEELQTIVRVCREKNTLIVSDDVWSDLTHGSVPHTSILSIAQEEGYGENVVVIYGNCKASQSSGFSANIASIPNQEMREFVAAKANRPLDISARATTAFMRTDAHGSSDGRAYLDALNPILKVNLQLAAEVLSRYGISAPIPDSTYFLFARVGRATPEGSRGDIIRLCLRTADIGFEGDMGTGTDEFIRISVGVPTEDLRRYFENFVRLMDNCGLKVS